MGVYIVRLPVKRSTYYSGEGTCAVTFTYNLPVLVLLCLFCFGVEGKIAQNAKSGMGR